MGLQDSLLTFKAILHIILRFNFSNTFLKILITKKVFVILHVSFEDVQYNWKYCHFLLLKFDHNPWNYILPFEIFYHIGKIANMELLEMKRHLQNRSLYHLFLSFWMNVCTLVQQQCALESKVFEKLNLKSVLWP